MIRRAAPVLILAAMLFVLLGAKSQLRFGIGPLSNDASYYQTIARHVASGQGLRTNLSLYNQGFQNFPHRTTTSPVWPLTLGGVGAVIGMSSAGRYLPSTLYFLSLILLYFLALRLWRATAGNAGGLLFREARVPNFGHLAVFILGANIIYFRYSSVPNNEPLAFCLLFASLIALDRAARSWSTGWAFAAGLLGGLALLTRAQMLPLLIAPPLVLAWIGLRSDRSLRIAGVALMGSVLPLLPWAVYVATWAEPFRLGFLIGLEVQRETPELREIPHSRVAPDLWSLLVDRAAGFRYAFDPNHRQSYVKHFGLVTYAVPLALIYIAAQLGRGTRGKWRSLAPEHAMTVAMVLVGVGMLIPVHMTHMAFSLEWIFGFRHGLPLLLLILPALAMLDSARNRVWPILGGLLIAFTLAGNTLKLDKLLDRNFDRGIGGVNRQLVAWLDSQRPRPSVITTIPWELGVFSRSGYHWTICDNTPEDTLNQLEHAGADYVLVYWNERKCSFIRGLPGRELFEVRKFGNGRLHVLAPRGRVPGG